MDRHRAPRQHRRVEVGVVLYCGLDSWSSAATGHKIVKISEWDLGLPTRDLEDLKGF
jgi:hypothetical protein